MRAILKSVWVRKLIGKLGVPYNRRLRVRGSPHPLDYGAVLPPRAAESKAFRIQSDLLSEVLAIAAFISRFSSGESRALTIMPRNLAFGTFGLPIFGFINTLCKTKIIVDKTYIPFYI
jgi:hypothetical protein